MKQLILSVAMSALIFQTANAYQQSIWLIKKCDGEVCRWTSHDKDFDTPTSRHLENVYKEIQASPQLHNPPNEISCASYLYHMNRMIDLLDLSNQSDLSKRNAKNRLQEQYEARGCK